MTTDDTQTDDQTGDQMDDQADDQADDQTDDQTGDQMDDQADDQMDDQTGGDSPETSDENAAEQETPKLSLEVAIDEPSACERHVTVTIDKQDVERYFDKEFAELRESAEVPGFRPGRAPRAR